jgi:hypothetical protein
MRELCGFWVRFQPRAATVREVPTNVFSVLSAGLVRRENQFILITQRSVVQRQPGAPQIRLFPPKRFPPQACYHLQPRGNQWELSLE